MSDSRDREQAKPTDPDAHYVAAARRGDLDAFESLVRNHQKRMLNIAFRLTNDYDEACEVVQDAFLSAHRNLGSFRGDAKFTTWLTAITVNFARNRLKRMKTNRARVPFSLDRPIETDDGTVLPDPPSREPSIVERLEQRDIRTAVRDCIALLEAVFREAVVLRDLQDLSYDEIGAMLGLAAGTVKSRIARGREAIKECLKNKLGDLA